MRVSCTVNGEPRQADDVWEGESLLYVLRERLGLPGSKNACEQGECGSCSVYLDGVLVCACLVLAGQAEGSEIVTVEGLAPGDSLHPVQEAFVEHGAAAIDDEQPERPGRTGLRQAAIDGGVLRQWKRVNRFDFFGERIFEFLRHRYA
jgi:hypothetical protein